LGIYSGKDNLLADPDHFQMLSLFVKQTALAVEGALLSAAAIEAESKMVNERIRNTLLTTFSYGLSEPLQSISQTASELLKPEYLNDEQKRTALLDKIRREIEHMNTFITELPKIIGSVK
jgi:K+-sensing histidine kinase KdpD